MLMFLPEKTDIVKTVEGQWDISEIVESKGYGIYLVEERDFDYSDTFIQNLAKNIKSSTSTPDAAVKQTIRYVVQNIKYSSAITVPYCYEETASSALESGVGDCVSMTRANVAILRAMGIPARSVGGCLTRERCAPLFAVVPGLEAQVTPMSEDDFKKRGFLHEWGEYFSVEDNSWKIFESTSGQIYDASCETYVQYSYDSNQYNRCVIQDASFWQTCFNS